ncbi:MAG: preprotein translocase subunit SecG [Alphaproteobacteria bacterium]|nr:preprotein translocase subunit SecG [Alphaproteobacteria bacterium]
MENVLLVVHVLIVIALIVIVLMQRSEGGALGMGGGGSGGGGFLTGRGTANLLTRTTAVLAVLFFATSIASTIMANRQSGGGSVFDSVGQPSATKSEPSAPGGGADKTPASGGGGILDDLEKGRGPLPSVPGGR